MNKWVLYVASTVHLIWGICILQGPAAMATTPTHVLGWLIPDHTWLGIGLLAISVCSLYSTSRADLLSLLLVLPQQATLMLSAAGSLSMVLAGHYADGVIRPQQFILADQITVVALAFGHSAAIIDYYGRMPIAQARTWWARQWARVDAPPEGDV